MKQRLLIIILSPILLLTSCAIYENTPIQTIDEQIDKFQSVIEDTATKKNKNRDYLSLAYGELKIFKPESFIRLDSAYKIKAHYMDRDDFKGLRQSKIEDLIPGYRAEAQKNIHEIRYEIEHLYQVLPLDSDSRKSLEIHHDFYLFNYQEELVSITPLYSFKIPKADKDLFYAYQFEYHFVDDRNLYISKAEQEFIRFFKNKEATLIGKKSHEDFISHTLQLMKFARRYGTVDFRELCKAIVIDYFSKMKLEVFIEKIHPLLSIMEEEINLGYTINIEWMDNKEKEMLNSTFHFSPFLEVLHVTTENMATGIIK